MGRHPAMMNWNQGKFAISQGHEIQSHSYSHPRLAELTDFKQKSQFELSGKMIVEKTGFKSQHMAYPFGVFNLKTLQYLKQHNYLTAFTVFPGENLVNDNPYLLRRYMVLSNHNLGDFQSKLLYKNLPVYKIQPKSGSIIKNNQLIEMILPRNLIQKNLKVFHGKRASIKIPAKTYYYDSKTGIFRLQLKNIRTRYRVVVIEYQVGERKFIFSNLYRLY